MDEHGGTRGQSLVEFALALPVLLLILIGITDLGRAFGAYIVMTNAAREGAYYGSLNPFDDGGIVSRVLSEAQGSGVGLTAGDVTITTSHARGSPLLVTVQYDFPFVTAFLFGADTLALTARASMMIL